MIAVAVALVALLLVWALWPADVDPQLTEPISPEAVDPAVEATPDQVERETEGN